MKSKYSRISKNSFLKVFWHTLHHILDMRSSLRILYPALWLFSLSFSNLVSASSPSIENYNLPPQSSETQFMYFLLVNPPLPRNLVKSQLTELDKLALSSTLGLAARTAGIKAKLLEAKMDEIPDSYVSDMSIKFMMAFGAICAYGSNVSKKQFQSMLNNFMKWDNSENSKYKGRAYAILTLTSALSKIGVQELRRSEYIQEELTEFSAQLLAGRILSKSSDYKAIGLIQSGRKYVWANSWDSREWIAMLAMLSHKSMDYLGPKYTSPYYYSQHNMAGLGEVIRLAFNQSDRVKRFAQKYAEILVMADKSVIEESKDQFEPSTDSNRCVYPNGRVYYDYDGSEYCEEIYFDSNGRAYKEPPTYLDNFVNSIRR
ncbi:MAG: hypothetical protein A4S09_10845 [Proteobacteria bacterium SG_bin7]|nr:MAG: hypothetical protein A4S09_10845 [Proteobacteria bacterium SG_bin7]